MKLPYTEGSLFRVPLPGGGAARGVVARASPEGKVLLGYFFGPRLSSSAPVTADHVDPAHALLRIRFGDLGLINGEWTVHGMVPGWDRSNWPMPDFVIRDPLGKRPPLRVHYSDSDPLEVLTRRPTRNDHGLARDSLFGYGAVEIALDKLLD